MIKAQAFKDNLRKIFKAVSATCMFMNFSISFELFNYLCVCSGMFSAAGMGLWHGVEHWEMNKINVETNTELFVKSWPEVNTFFVNLNFCKH